jgi:hypothetical protein
MVKQSPLLHDFRNLHLNGRGYLFCQPHPAIWLKVNIIWRDGMLLNFRLNHSVEIIYLDFMFFHHS